jgi:hypothetical protein
VPIILFKEKETMILIIITFLIKDFKQKIRNNAPVYGRSAKKLVLKFWCQFSLKKERRNTMITEIITFTVLE